MLILSVKGIDRAVSSLNSIQMVGTFTLFRFLAQYESAYHRVVSLIQKKMHFLEENASWGVNWKKPLLLLRIKYRM